MAINGVASTPSSLSLSGASITLNFSYTFKDTDTVSVSYTPGKIKLQDIAGNLVGAISNFSATNMVIAN